MTSVMWPRVKVNRLLAVLLAMLIFVLLVSLQTQLVFQQGATSVFQQVQLWSQFCVTILVALIFLAVGALVWLYARDRRVALILFGFCSTMMVTFAALGGGSIGKGWFSTLTSVISSVATTLSVPLLALFLLRFPKTYYPQDAPQEPHQCSAWFLLLRGYLLCLGGASLLLTLGTLVELVFPAQILPFEDVLSLVFDFYYPVGIIGCLTTIIISYRRSSTPRERQQMRLLVGGAILALLPVLLLTVLPTTFNLPPQEIVDGRISALSLGLLPLAVGYSILRYQILIFDRYIRRAVAGIVGCVGLALFGFCMLALNGVLLSGRISFAPVSIIALTLLGAPFIWIRMKVVTDRLFFSEVLNLRHLIDKSATLINETLSLNEASSLLTTVAIDTFTTQQVCFFVADKESKSYCACPSLSDDDAHDARRTLVHYLAQLEEPIVVMGTEAALHPSVVERLGAASRPLLLYKATGGAIKGRCSSPGI